MDSIRHSSVVTSEALSVISKLNKMAFGFQYIKLEFCKLDEKLSETVIDQFVQHTKYLYELNVSGKQDLPETDKPNVLELASRILEEQDEPMLQDLTLSMLSSKSAEEPTEEDKRLINAVVQSGFNRLTSLHLDDNASWFSNSEV